MIAPLSKLLEDSVQIAWDYLQRSGELQDGSVATRFLTDSIDLMIRQGKTNRMFLANKAIAQYMVFTQGQNVVRLSERAGT
jgi:hypothetical protein